MQRIIRLIVAVFVVSIGANAIGYDQSRFIARPQKTTLYKTKFFETTFHHTKALWADDSVSSFRNTFKSSYWDEQENKQSVATKSNSTRIEFEFPMQKTVGEEPSADISGPIYLSLEINH